MQMSQFGDPTWEYHAAQAKVAALTAHKLVGTQKKIKNN